MPTLYLALLGFIFYVPTKGSAAHSAAANPRTNSTILVYRMKYLLLRGCRVYHTSRIAKLEYQKAPKHMRVLHVSAALISHSKKLPMMYEGALASGQRKLQSRFGPAPIDGRTEKYFQAPEQREPGPSK